MEASPVVGDFCDEDLQEGSKLDLGNMRHNDSANEGDSIQLEEGEQDDIVDSNKARKDAKEARSQQRSNHQESGKMDASAPKDATTQIVAGAQEDAPNVSTRKEEIVQVDTKQQVDANNEEDDAQGRKEALGLDEQKTKHIAPIGSNVELHGDKRRQLEVKTNEICNCFSALVVVEQTSNILKEQYQEKKQIRMLVSTNTEGEEILQDIDKLLMELAKAQSHLFMFASCLDLSQLPDDFMSLIKAAGVAMVTEIDVHRNALTDLPSEIEKFNTVKVLKLNANRFYKLPDPIFTFAKLQVLDVSENNLKEMDEDLRRFVYLRELNYSKNQLTYLPNFWGHFGVLVSVNLWLFEPYYYFWIQLGTKDRCMKVVKGSVFSLILHCGKTNVELILQWSR
eukprot:Gb_34563 [translate_table: standard]